MNVEEILTASYHLLAALVALGALFALFRAKDWPSQFFAIVVFVPFALRAAGIK